MEIKVKLFRVLLGGALLLAGCAASSMEDVQQSGFLGDYSQLQEGGNDQAAQVYFKPGVDFTQYDKLMFDRVVVLLSNTTENRQVDAVMRKELTDYYQNALYAAFKDGYQIVYDPAPGVLRVRATITDLKASNPTVNTLSTLVPVGIVVSGATKAVSGDNLGTGEAASEIDVLDALTGERLAAAVDRRQGGKGVFRGEWEDAKEAIDFWAKRFRQRLDEMRRLK